MTAPAQGAAGLDIAAYLPTWTAAPAETDLPAVDDLVGGLHPETDPALTEETTLTTETETVERPTKRAGALIAGTDHLMYEDEPRPVLHVEPFTIGTQPWVVIVLDHGQTLRDLADQLRAVATPEEIAQAESHALRVGVVAQIRALADLIERHAALPVPASIAANIATDGPYPYSTVAAVASALSVPFEQVTENTRQATYELFGPARVTYTVSAYVPKSADTEAGA